MKSRSGDTVKLRELLDEARDRAYQINKDRLAEFGEESKQTEEEMLATAEIVGITSIKYFDLR